MEQIVTKEEYCIKLTVEELDFIQNVLKGVNEFLRHLHHDLGIRNTEYVLLQAYNNTEINPLELSSKIFMQYHEPKDGELVHK